MGVTGAALVPSIAVLLASASCGYDSEGPKIESADFLLYLGTVRNLKSGSILVQTCSNAYGEDEPGKRMRFEAPRGAMVELEVMFEYLSVEYDVDKPSPVRDLDFWCSSESRKSLDEDGIPGFRWGCLRIVDTDPPVKILKIEPRGRKNDETNPRSDGYALTLEILHAGVLHTQQDSNCNLTGVLSSGNEPSADPVRVELEVL